ncbi:MAG: hypothetical protein KME06_08035 [Kastovskya adunca ATA6-11-RM4]|nr:hypothetical protein [Kastovskya adunca ATA6-11-RM4]
MATRKLSPLALLIALVLSVTVGACNAEREAPLGEEGVEEREELGGGEIEEGEEGEEVEEEGEDDD